MLFRRKPKENQEQKQTQPKRPNAGIPRTYELPQATADKMQPKEKTPPPAYFYAVVCLAIPLLCCGLSELLSWPFSGVYRAYILPPPAPELWLLAAISIPLFLSIGFASYLIWKTPPSVKRSKALVFYLAMLSLSFIWPILFFLLGLLMISSCEIILLAVIAHLTIDSFESIDTRAAWLIFPYFLFISFIAYINTGIALLN